MSSDIFSEVYQAMRDNRELAEEDMADGDDTVKDRLDSQNFACEAGVGEPPATTVPQRVLVTGGCGYVGSVLVQELLGLGYQVLVLDRCYFGNSYGDEYGTNSYDKNLTVFQKDIRDIQKADIASCDACIHLAGLSNDPTAEYNPEANREINTTATLRLAKLCAQVGINRFVFASSASLYDISWHTEEEQGVCDENTAIDVKAPYSFSKYEAELALLHIMREHPNFQPVVLRKGTVYGWSRRMRFDLVVNTMVRDVLQKGYINLHNDGAMWRPMLDIWDAARAYIVILQAPASVVAGKIYNVANANYRISELALHIADWFRRNQNVVVPIHMGQSGPVRSYRMSCDRIRQELGWYPQRSLKDCLESLANSVMIHNRDFDNPVYYNIQWMRFLDTAFKLQFQTFGKVF